LPVRDRPGHETKSNLWVELRPTISSGDVICKDDLSVFQRISCGRQAMPNTDFRLRRATPSDAEAIARTHRDSIETIGPHFYLAEIVREWGSGLTPDSYRRAMEHGEAFFIAVDANDTVLGFSTHRVDGSQHGTAVYVRGSAARRGVGSALYRRAEAQALSAGAERIVIDASLAAVEFYKAHGFEETGRGDHRLRSGRRMPCVFMRKTLHHRGDQTDIERSNGYESAASEFIARRRTEIGVATLRSWASSLRPGGSVLDLGCGHGDPVSKTLMDLGFEVYGVEASPSLAAAFRARFPDAPIVCEPVESSRFFDRTFDAIVTIGLMFLLRADAQADLIRRAAGALNAGGRFLFTSPAQSCTWTDVLTGRRSTSLGAVAYKALLAEAGLAVIGEYQDEGENHYFDAAPRQAYD